MGNLKLALCVSGIRSREGTYGRLTRQRSEMEAQMPATDGRRSLVRRPWVGVSLVAHLGIIQWMGLYSSSDDVSFPHLRSQSSSILSLPCWAERR